jgi:hypothetical protein
MTDVVVFEFFSDTNQANAADELEAMELEYFVNGQGFIEVGKIDFDAMGDSITAIVKENGGFISQ